jgi:hypothetical protein
MMRCGWGNTLHTSSLTRGDTPTPALPRKRERECSAFVAAVQTNPIARYRQPKLEASVTFPLPFHIVRSG